MFYLRLLCLTPCRSDCALKDGTVHWIPRITFSFITWQDVDVKRVQFPVRLCFALPVHRSQGQTLKSVVLIYAGIFSCTDAYMSAYLGFGNPPTLKFDD